jgi:hypothetical protein
MVALLRRGPDVDGLEGRGGCSLEGEGGYGEESAWDLWGVEVGRGSIVGRDER